MSNRTINAKITSRLLIAAALVDFLLLLILAKILAPFVGPMFSYGPILSHLATLLGLLLLHWFVVEVLLAGHSLGRLCLGLEVRTEHGGHPGVPQRIRRFLFKALSLGLAGLVIDRPAHYDNGMRWVSDLGPGDGPPRGSTGRGGGRLRVETGPDAGTLCRLPQDGTVRIGREPGWSDLRLGRSGNVSGRHCILRVRAGRIEIMDCGSDGRGSKNGTMVARRMLRPGEWYALGSVKHFHVANVRIAIGR